MHGEGGERAPYAALAPSLAYMHSSQGVSCCQLQSSQQCNSGARMLSKLTWEMTLFSRSSPISGNLVLMMATRAAYVAVKVGDASWDFIRLRQKTPRPLIRFCMHTVLSPRILLQEGEPTEPLSCCSCKMLLCLWSARLVLPTIELSCTCHCAGWQSEPTLLAVTNQCLSLIERCLDFSS